MIKIEEELKKGSEISIIKLIDGLIEYGYDSRASDIHIDPEETGIRVRLRVDGILKNSFIFPKEIHSEIITRIKILAGLRTDDHQTPQDGRFRLTIKKINLLDIRVSIIPTYYGENAIMRLLAEKTEKFTLETLGFNERNRNKILDAIKKPYGMILCTGPTGSGKTTSLYTIIKLLNKPEVSIITIEDPIEYSVEGVDQIQVNPHTGLTFASGLRSILRQDPNIIMVGEIRDEETAGIAINASLTGHLLLSTIHTNDASTTLPRLLDMKVESFLIASTVNIAIAQRLVRKICSNCKVKKIITEDKKRSLSEVLSQKILHDYKEFYEGKGCSMCNNTGYYGRVSIHEILVVNDEIREAITRKANASEIKEIAIKNGMETMVEDGFKKVIEGVTTIEEILRVIHE